MIQRLIPFVIIGVVMVFTGGCGGKSGPSEIPTGKGALVKPGDAVPMSAGGK